MQMMLALALAGSAVRAAQAERLRRTSNGGFRQTLHNYQNVQYFADFDIGGQQIAGIFDTGSFELLVRSSRCDHCIHPTPPYDHKRSDTYRSNGTVAKHVFGSGPCVSVMGYESVTVGGVLHAERQAFWEIVDHRIRVLDTARFAAIVGIGPNFAAENAEKTLLTSYGISAFSICLQRESGSPGFLTWDAPRGDDEGRIVVPVIGKHHWVTRLQDVTFIKPLAHLEQIPCGDERGCAAIIDSGTSLIAAPGIALMLLSEQIPPIKEDCSNLDDLPTLLLKLDGHDLELPPEAYVMRVTGAVLTADDVWDVLFFKPRIRRLDMCMPAFMQIDMMSQFGPVWILGMPFLRYYHTTFDRERREMRLAAAGDSCEALPLHTGNGSAAMLQRGGRAVRAPMPVEVDAIVPPRLSGMMDYPFGSDGEMDL
mmetsp:Transcript_112774/g.297828  ORF Transcript_112774/g.297828 Transcript_112774/m.297828 type:complete len:424 (-) Transcript_112774:89-1360(-)